MFNQSGANQLSLALVLYIPNPWSMSLVYLTSFKIKLKELCNTARFEVRISDFEFQGSY